MEATCLAHGIIVVLFALWTFPKWQVAYTKNLTPEQRFDRENEARRTLAQVLGGGVLLIGIYFTWRQLRISQEGQITDRFTKAIAQLGDDQLAVRLGGIYALERIARDSERDHWPVMEVLTAFARENSLKRLAASMGGAESVPALAPDIQAILTVLGRRELSHEQPDKHLFLHGARLCHSFLVYCPRNK